MKTFAVRGMSGPGEPDDDSGADRDSLEWLSAKWTATMGSIDHTTTDGWGDSSVKASA
jgi:hypothetical protein